MDRTRPKELKTTSRSNSSESPTRNVSGKRGFTLIEIMIVLAIIAMIVSLGLPAIERVTYQRINSTTRKFVGMVRTIRNDAILLNNIYRLVIDLEKNTYWVESQRELKMLSEEDSLPQDKKKKLKKGEEPPPSNFIMVEKYSKEPTPLPTGVVIPGVLKERDGLRNQGLAYIHFFPNGFNEAAIVYLTKERSKEVMYSVLIKSSLGQVEVFRERLESFNPVARR